MNVSLPKHWEDFIGAKIKSGRYYNQSEVIRAGLRLLEEEDQRKAAALESIKRGEESQRRPAKLRKP